MVTVNKDSIPQMKKKTPSSGAKHSTTSTSAAAASTTIPSLGSLPTWNAIGYAANTAVTYVIGSPQNPAKEWLGLDHLPDNATLSRKYQTLVTPAAWAFAIWGIIFGMQLAWVVAQQFLRRRHDDKNNKQPQDNAVRVVDAIGMKYVGVCLAQIAWTVAFAHEHLTASLACMVTLLLLLQRIVTDVEPLMANSTGTAVQTVTYWLYQFPFSLHYGWICCATAVNLGVVMVGWEASPKLQFGVSVASLAMLLPLSFYKLLQGFDCTVPAVVVHALLAVFAELNNTKDETILSRFSEPQLDTVKYGSLGVATFILIFIAGTII